MMQNLAAYFQPGRVHRQIYTDPAIFDLEMERQPDPRGDRVRITMSGKFLPYKYYGASGNAPQYGYKEE